MDFLHVTHTILTNCEASAIMIYQFLISGMLTKIQRAALSFFTAVCLSVCPHGTIRLALDEFSWNLEYFRKSVKINQVSLKS